MIVHKEKIDALAQKITLYAKEHLNADSATIVALRGDLGAGKTTLVQHIAKVLGIEESVPSPTFVLMKRYATQDSVFTTLVHIDAYRIETLEELAPLHLDEVFADTHSLVCVEWPDKLGTNLPKGAISLTLSAISEDEREVVIEAQPKGFFED